MDISRFLDIEEKYDLYHRSVMGVNYWMYYRANIWDYSICIDEHGPDPSRLSKKQPVLNILKRMRSALYIQKTPKSADILFFIGGRRIKNGSFYECPYTEDLSAYFKNSVTVEQPFEYHHYTPVKTNNLVYDDYIGLKASAVLRYYRHLRPKFVQQVSQEIYQQLESAFNEFEREFNWHGNKAAIIHSLTVFVLTHSVKKKEYRKLLQKINPAVVVEVCHYSFDKMVLNEAAAEVGIPTIELQHGVIAEGHIGYQYCTKEILPQLPKKIFLFSDFWKKTIHMPLAEENLIPVGYPVFDKSIITHPKCIEKKQYTVLFISQPHVGNALSKIAHELATSLPQDRYRIIYKLHPKEYSSWKQQYPELNDIPIEVIVNNQHSIYKYFSESDMQIGANSTAIYEGLGYQLTTLILRTGDYKMLDGLVISGYAQYISTTEDILHILSSSKNSFPSGCTEFWKPNALDNMVYEIEKHLK